MIGSAAARHAAKMTRDNRIALIGPSEHSECASSNISDDDVNTQRTIFGAHYDEGRITRSVTDPDEIWAELASRSIDRYDEIVQDSLSLSNNFYCECGHLAVGLNNSDMMNRRIQIAESMGVEYISLDEEKLRGQFPYLSFPRDCVGLHETKHSGYISARRLVQAQTDAARNLGVEVIDSVVNGVERRMCETTCELYFHINVAGSSKETITANKVLVACGAFCNAQPLLPRKLELMPIKTQTVHFVLTEEDAIRLKGMPSIITKTDELWAYMLPPISYPDGTIRLKLGGSYLDKNGDEVGPNRQMQTDQEVVDWYRSYGDDDMKRDMVKMLHSFVPNINPISIISDTCATLNTLTRQAFIGEIEDGWAVATGGNGSAAKSSDELGRLAAMCILNRQGYEQERICGKLCADMFRPKFVS